MTKKPPRTYYDYFPKLGRELIRVLSLRKGHYYKLDEGNDYERPEYRHLLDAEE